MTHQIWVRAPLGTNIIVLTCQNFGTVHYYICHPYLGTTLYILTAIEILAGKEVKNWSMKLIYPTCISFYPKLLS